MANSQTPGELKNCKLENPSLLFGSLAQYPGSDKRRVLSPCITYGRPECSYWLLEVDTGNGEVMIKINWSSFPSKRHSKFQTASYRKQIDILKNYTQMSNDILVLHGPAS